MRLSFLTNNILTRYNFRHYNILLATDDAGNSYVFVCKLTGGLWAVNVLHEEFGPYGHKTSHIDLCPNFENQKAPEELFSM